MKVALFGGSFNPVHNEHINIVKAAISGLNLDKVIVMPSYITPAKNGRITAPAAERYELCRLAFGGMKGAEVSDFELSQGGTSYTYLTVTHLKEIYKTDELYLIVGADSYENFSSWKNPQEILKRATLAVCGREKPAALRGDGAAAFPYIGAKVSSTRIRTLAALGEDIGEYTPKTVADYITENSLYALGIASEVKKYLTPSRWKHTVGVALCAAENCARLGIDEKSALTAAVLHDCAKYLKPDSPELFGFVPPEGVPEPVVHQYAGAFVAEKIFGVKDEDILNAIRYHTSGRENMSDLEKLIFLSDLLEEGRSFPDIEKLRESFSHSLNGGMLSALSHQLAYLKSTGEKIYPLTQTAYNSLVILSDTEESSSSF